MPNLANLVHTRVFYRREMMKSCHPSFPSFNPFVIVFYFLFRRLAKRAAQRGPIYKTNDYYYDAAQPAIFLPASYPYEHHAEYVQLFS